MLMLFTACSDTLVSNDCDDTGEEIIVEAYIDGLQNNRAVQLNAKSLNKFAAYGMYNGTIKANNVAYTKNATTGAWKSNKVVTWANKGMNFYGISPSYNIATNDIKQTMLPTSQSFEYSTVRKIDEQVDFMFSSLFDVTKKTNNGKVVFSFKPAPHYFTYTIRSSLGTGYKIYVKSIIVHNLIINGTFKFSATTANTGTFTAKSGTDAVYANDTLVLATPLEVTSTNKSLGEVEVCIPQKTTKWTTTKASPVPTSTADTKHNWYVELKAQIIKINDDTSETYLLGNNPDQTASNYLPGIAEYESVYFPMNAKDCKLGKGTTWPITFNGGYNSDGDLYLENIPDRTGGDGIEVEVAEWFQSDFDIEEWTPYVDNPIEIELK